MKYAFEIAEQGPAEPRFVRYSRYFCWLLAAVCAGVGLLLLWAVTIRGPIVRHDTREVVQRLASDGIVDIAKLAQALNKDLPSTDAMNDASARIASRGLNTVRDATLVFALMFSLIGIVCWNMIRQVRQRKLPSLGLALLAGVLCAGTFFFQYLHNFRLSPRLMGVIHKVPLLESGAINATRFAEVNGGEVDRAGFVIVGRLLGPASEAAFFTVTWGMHACLAGVAVCAMLTLVILIGYAAGQGKAPPSSPVA